MPVKDHPASPGAASKRPGCRPREGAWRANADPRASLGPCIKRGFVQVQHDTNSDTTPWVPYAWIEALDDEWLFIATDSSVAAFRRCDLPRHWSERFKSPGGNLVLAQEIDTRGSPGDTPLDRVSRIEWPLDAVEPLPSGRGQSRGDALRGV